MRRAAALGTHVHPACDDAGSRFLGRNNEAREEGVHEAKHAWLRQRLELFCSGSIPDSDPILGHSRSTFSSGISRLLDGKRDDGAPDLFGDAVLERRLLPGDFGQRALAAHLIGHGSETCRKITSGYERDRLVRPSVEISRVAAFGQFPRSACEALAFAW